MKHKVVEFNGLDQMENVVTVYRFDEVQLRYLIFVERGRWPGSPKGGRDRARFAQDKLAQYAALGPVVHCYMEATDDWDDTDPQQRDRRGL